MSLPRIEPAASENPEMADRHEALWCNVLRYGLEDRTVIFELMTGERIVGELVFVGLDYVDVLRSDRHVLIPFHAISWCKELR